MSLWEKELTGYKSFCNDLVCVDSSDWTAQATGSVKLPKNKTGKICLIKLNAPTGSKITKVTLHGGAGATTDKATSTTLSIRKVINKAGGVTDSEVKGVSAVSVVADTKLDIEAIFSEVVKEGYSYYAKVTATTADDDACDLELIGATVEYI
jgi:hypothetical protein